MKHIKTILIICFIVSAIIGISLLVTYFIQKNNKVKESYCNDCSLVPFNERMGKEHMSDLESYYYRVYPAAKDGSYSREWMDDLNFYYEFIPETFIKSQGNIYFPSEHDWNPPEMNKLWYPIWYNGGPDTGCGSSCARNLYPPNNWLDYKNRKGFESNTFVESLHTIDDNPFYTVSGFWLYYAVGSGVWIDIGRTVKAVNKIHALNLLGLDEVDIGGLIMTSEFMVNNSPLSLKVVDLVKKLYPHIPQLKNACIELVKEILTFSTQQSPTQPLAGGELERMYLIDRVNNSADWDSYISMIARSQGYQSIQFTVQANGNGGWAHEIVYCGTTPLVKIVESEWGGWAQIKSKITIADPMNTYSHCQCDFTPGISRVVCDAQDIPKTACGGGSGGGGGYKK